MGNQDANVDNTFDEYVCNDHRAGNSFELY